jgi:ribonuclease P protein component
MKKFPFSSRYRLRRSGEIARVFEAGRRTNDARITLQGMPREAPGPSRCAVAVGRRHGPAVVRNRLKRICREAFRLTRPHLPEPWDYVIIPRRGRTLTVAGVGQSLRALAGRLASQVDDAGESG